MPKFLFLYYPSQKSKQNNNIKQTKLNKTELKNKTKKQNWTTKQNNNTKQTKLNKTKLNWTEKQNWTNQSKQNKTTT